MKIVIPTKNDYVEDHFGHCEHYTVYETDDQNNIISKELFRTQGGCGCKSDIAGILKEIGVSVMLAGKMGKNAFNMLNSREIKVVIGCQGSPDHLVKTYLEGKLSEGEITCDQHV